MHSSPAPTIRAPISQVIPKPVGGLYYPSPPRTVRSEPPSRTLPGYVRPVLTAFTVTPPRPSTPEAFFGIQMVGGLLNPTPQPRPIRRLSGLLARRLTYRF